MEKYSFMHEGVFDYQTAEDHDFFMPVFTLFLNESSLVVKEEKKAEGLNGGWFYKHLSTRTYRSYTNKHGEKYLVVSMKTSDGRVFSKSANNLHDDPFLYKTVEGKSYCEAMIAMIENHITKLLGFTFTYKVVPEIGEDDDVWYEGEVGWETAPETLCYPFLRDKDNKEWMMSVLKENHARREESAVAYASTLRDDGPRGLVAAWRSSKTPEDFIRSMVYKSAIQTTADLECLITDPSLIRLFSNLNLKMGAKEALDKGYVAIFKDSYKFMSIPELYGFKFLLDNLPKGMTVQALDLASRLAEFRKNQPIFEDDDMLCKLVEFQDKTSWRSPLSGTTGIVQKYLKFIPASDRQRFAVAFLEDFKAAYLSTEEGYALAGKIEDLKSWEHTNACFIPVMDSLMKVHTSIYLKSQTSDCLARTEAASIELFGVDISLDTSLSTGSAWIEKFNTTVYFYDFAKHVSEEIGSFGYQGTSEPKNLFKLFRSSYDTSPLWMSVFYRPACQIFRNYLPTFDYGRSGTSRFVLASDLEMVFREIAAKIDKALLKVGQLPTPENRMLYMEARYEDKKYKSSWRYYQMGVPVDETPLYKKAGFKSKKDILYWLGLRATLPVGMYKEFLNDAAGTTSEEKSSETGF